MPIATFPIYATGDTIEASWANDIRSSFLTVDGRTGGDPAAALKTLVSNGSLTGQWLAGLTNAYLAAGVAVANLGYTPVNKAGDSMSGTLSMANNIALRLLEASAFPRDVLKMTGSDVIEFGNANNLMDFLSAQLTLRNSVYIALKEASGFVRTVLRMNASDQIEMGNANNILKLIGSEVQANGSRVLTTSEEGSGGGIDADTVDGVHEAALAKLAGAAFTGNISTSGTLGVTGTTTAAAINSGAVTSSSTVQGTRLISTQATGTAPLTVTSTTKVSNLNADRLDDLEAADFAASGHTHANPTGMAKIASGTYTGTGGNRSFTGLGFTPKAVFIQQTTTVSGRIMFFMGHDAVTFFHLSSPSFIAGQSLDADGFTITSGSAMNNSPEGFRWWAVG